MDAFDISEVASRTGLSSRALRFYEARGLVAPLRTASGRRLFGAAELARLHQLVLLKRAGFTLADIKRLFDNKTLDLGALLRAQIIELDDQFCKLGRRVRCSSPPCPASTLASASMPRPFAR